MSTAVTISIPDALSDALTSAARRLSQPWSPISRGDLIRRACAELIERIGPQLGLEPWARGENLAAPSVDPIDAAMRSEPPDPLDAEDEQRATEEAAFAAEQKARRKRKPPPCPETQPRPTRRRRKAGAK